MVQVFMALGRGELEAFRAYAEVYPDECILLVDTIDTLESGIPNAITVFEELRTAGHEPVGIRLDSGDLAYLSIEAAEMLDAAGFEDAQIVLSGNLDELEIWQIRAQILDEYARAGKDPSNLMERLVYGVGTRLITSQGHEALDGVYKLVAVEEGGEWTPAIKVSDTPEKVPIPGDKKVWRLYDSRGRATVDLIGMAGEELPESDLLLHHPHRMGISRVISRGEITQVEDLLVEVFRGGQRTTPSPNLEEMRARRLADLDRLDVGCDVVQHPLVVSDDEKAALVIVKPLDAFGNGTQRIDVKTRIRFVEYRQLRVQHGHLEYLVALALATGEPFVEIAVGERCIHAERRHCLRNLQPQFEHGVVGAGAVGQRRPEEVENGNARYLLGILESEKHPRAAPFLRSPLRDVFTLVHDLAGRDLVAGMAHENVRQCRLAGTVWPHQGVDLSSFDGEVHSFDDFDIAGGCVQVFDSK